MEHDLCKRFICDHRSTANAGVLWKKGYWSPQDFLVISVLRAANQEVCVLTLSTAVQQDFWMKKIKGL